MSAYVPPWKRKAAEPAASTLLEAGPSTPLARTRSNGEYRVVDVLDHLGGRRMGTIQLFSYLAIKVPEKTVKELIEKERQREKYKAEKAEMARKRWLEKQEQATSTLLPDEEKEMEMEMALSSKDEISPRPLAPRHPHGHLISWIHYMAVAHPRFSTDQELWFHTNSHVVTDTKENVGRPIPLFGQLEETIGSRARALGYSSHADKLAFLGYWTIESVHAVPKQSEELRLLLEAKQANRNYAKGGRSPEAWKASMEEQWVKVKVKRMEVGEVEEETGIKYQDPMAMKFDNDAEGNGQGWLDFVLRDVRQRYPSASEDLVEPTRSLTLNETSGPVGPTSDRSASARPGEPFRPDVPVPVLPSRFDEDEERKQETAEAREQRMVHDVYETIAPHFSKTRYKPWPIITRFLSSIPPNSIGLDSGAGNGKYLPVVRQVSSGSRMIALDRSSGLLGIARGQRGEDGVEGGERVGVEVVGGVEECVRGDLGFEGWREGVFDFTISIAAVHHLSTRPRRTSAIRTLLLPLFLSPHAPHSRFIVYVWAYEQGESSKRKMGVLAPGPNSGEGDDGEVGNGGMGEGKGDQDVLVPWVLQEDQKKKEKKRKRKVVPRSAKNMRPGEEDLNKQEHDGNDDQVDRAEKAVEVDGAAEDTIPDPPRQVYHRYYHLYTEGELREDVIRAAEEMGFDVMALSGDHIACINDNKDSSEGKDRNKRKWLKITGEGYEKDNWYLEGEVGLYA